MLNFNPFNKEPIEPIEDVEAVPIEEALRVSEAETKMAEVERFVDDVAEEALDIAHPAVEQMDKDKSWWKKGLEMYEKLDKQYQRFEQKITSRVSKIVQKVESKKGDSASVAALKWSGRALLTIPKIAAVPILFPKDIIMASVKGIENSRAISSIEKALNGTEGPEKLLQLMKLEAGSEEEAIIKEMLASKDEAVKNQVLDVLSRKLAEQSQIELNKKTKFTKYFGANAEVPRSVMDANAQMEIIYQKHGVNSQNYAACKIFEENLKAKDPKEYKKLKILHAQIFAKKEDEETDLKIKGGWNFGKSDTSLQQKSQVVSNSFKNGMLWHLMHDPGEIASLMTCVVNGEYVHNLGKFDIKDAFASRQMHARVAQDLLLIRDKDTFSPEMQQKIDKCFNLSDKDLAMFNKFGVSGPKRGRAHFLKKHSNSGVFAASSYVAKETQTLGYLTMRGFVGIPYDQYKFWTSKQKESVIASEIDNSGLAHQYANLMYDISPQKAESRKQEERVKQDFSNIFGAKLMNIKSGGAESLVRNLIDRLIVKNAQGGQPRQEEIEFLRRMQEFAAYQTDQGRMNAA